MWPMIIAAAIGAIGQMSSAPPIMAPTVSDAKVDGSGWTINYGDNASVKGGGGSNGFLSDFLSGINTDYLLLGAAVFLIMGGKN